MENNIEMIENMLNTERRNRRGNREIRFEVNSNYYEAVSKLLSDYKRVLKELEEKTTILLAGAEKVKQLEKENEELNLKYHMLYTEKIDKQKAQEVKIKSQVIPIQKVKDKISERQFELQQEYKDFEDDSILIALQELLEGRK